MTQPSNHSHEECQIDERDAFVKLDPSGLFIRHPPKPHELDPFITPDDELFQTIHMGAAVVDLERWKLRVTGMVKHPFILDLQTLRSEFVEHHVTSFHECFGSPVRPATHALWRIGNVRWTGVRLKDILRRAQPLSDATFIWSEGLDRGKFAGVEADSYQKDLPLEKAMADEVLIAYAVNGGPLSKERGGPVRLVVPGWFGTNSTKWLCKLELQDRRAPGPYTTKFYNVPDLKNGGMMPVWHVEPNSMITKPAPRSRLAEGSLDVEGWAWAPDGIASVSVSTDDGVSWTEAKLERRVDFSWQRFQLSLQLYAGHYTIVARATGNDGRRQPLEGYRNHCHHVECEVDNA